MPTFRIPPDAEVVKRLSSLIPLAYAFGILSARNQSDMASNIEANRSGSFSNRIVAAFTKPKGPSARLTHAEFKEKYELTEANDFCFPMETIDFPVVGGNHQDEVWGYDVDAELIKNYDIYPLFGKYGIRQTIQQAIVGLIAIDKESCSTIDRNYIVFKGTQGGVGLASVLAGFFNTAANADWNTDLAYKLEQFEGINGKTHRGFNAVLASVQQQIWSILTKYHHRERKLVIAGHSLGGAVARLTGCLLFTNPPKDKRFYAENLAIYSYAAPAIGDRTFEANFLALPLNEKFLFYIKGDPVVETLPPPRAYHLLIGLETGDFSELVPAFSSKVEDSERHYFDAINFLLYKYLKLEPISRIRCFTTKVSNAISHFAVQPTSDSMATAFTGITYSPAQYFYSDRGQLAQATSVTAQSASVAEKPSSVLYKLRYVDICQQLCQGWFSLLKVNEDLFKQTMSASTGLQKLYENTQVDKVDNDAIVLIIMMSLVLESYYRQMPRQTKISEGFTKMIKEIKEIKNFKHYLFTEYYCAMLKKSVDVVYAAKVDDFLKAIDVH
jgi:hypothetical protein